MNESDDYEEADKSVDDDDDDDEESDEFDDEVEEEADESDEEESDYSRPTLGCRPDMCQRKRKKCDLCLNYLELTDTITRKIDGATFPITRMFHFKTPLTVYVISCTLCRIDYVGSSNNVFRRVQSHKSHIKSARNGGNVVSALAGHFSEE